MYREVMQVVDLLIGALFWLGRIAGRVAWRCRAGLIPVWTAALVVVSAAVLRWFAPGWWWTPIAAGLLAAPPLFWLGDRLTGRGQAALAWLVPDWLDNGRKGVLDRPTERGYLAVLALAVTGWWSWLARYGWNEPTWWWFVGFTAAMGAPWWWHRGYRRRKRPNRWAMRWPRVADAIKEFDGSRVVAHAGDKHVTELTVVLRPGQTINSVGDRALQVASALSPRLRAGAVTMSSSGAARRVAVRIVPRDPWSGVITHPRPAVGSVELDRDDRVMVGQLEDRAVLLHRMRQHTLAVAQSGGGKSVMLDALIAWMVIARAPWVGIDMASGVSLGEWEPCMAVPMATNAAQAMELLRGVMNVVEFREQEMKRLKVKVWPYNDLFVVIDEFPTLVRTGGKQIIALLTILAERMRKTRCWLYPAAQNGSKDDLGSTEFRAQMMCVLGGRLDRHMNTLLWGDKAKTGWDGTSLQTGTWLLHDSTRDVPRVAKGVFLSEADQRAIVADGTRRGHRAELDTGSRSALTGSGVSTPVGTTVIDAPVEQPRRLTVVESAPSPLDDLDRRVLAELPAAGQGSGGASAIAGQLGVDRGKVERALRRMEKQGLAQHTGERGGWSAC